MAGVVGRAWLSEPAARAIVIRASVRERTARRAVPTLRGEAANIVDRLTSGPVGKKDEVGGNKFGISAGYSC